jgi:hypothetical protein
MTAGSKLVVSQINVTGGIIIPILTTTERNNVYPHESTDDATQEGKGALIYNETTNKMEFYDGVDWTPTKAGFTVQF